MPTGIKEGIGATVGFGTSSLTLNIVDVNLDGITMEDIATFDQSTTGYRTYIASTLTEGGTLSFDVNWNALDHVALEGALGVSQTITVTLPKVVSTDTTAPSYSFSGYVNSLSKSVVIDELISGSVQIKVAGDITFVNGAA
jgi:hypothetical protein